MRSRPRAFLAVLFFAGLAPAAAFADPAADLLENAFEALSAGHFDLGRRALRELGPRHNTATVRKLLAFPVELERRGDAIPTIERASIMDAVIASLAAAREGQAVDELLRQAGGRAGPARMVALEAAIQGHRDRAVPVLVETLRERRADDTLRLLAVRGLARIADPRGVAPLIELLEKEEKERGRVYWDIHDALHAITGHRFDDHARWSAFWKVRGPRWDPARDRPRTGARAGAAGPPVGSVRGPRLFGGTEISSRRIIFVIDTSGSMNAVDPQGQGPATGPGSGPAPPPGATRLDRVKLEFARLIEELPDGTRYNIVAFSSTATPWVRGELQAATGPNRARSIAFVLAFQAEGGTNLLDAMTEAFAIRGADTIYVLSDGSPNDPAGTLAMVKAVNRFRLVKIHTLGFPGSSEGFMQELAEAGCGGDFRPIR